MILGFNLFYDGAGTTAYHTNPFPRRGLAALFSLQTTHFGGTITLDASVEHKNRDESGWTAAGAFSGIAGTGVSTVDISGLKEEIRFAFAFSGSGSLGDFFRVYIPPPAWRPYT